jgi:hypothetical protein
MLRKNVSGTAAKASFVKKMGARGRYRLEKAGGPACSFYGAT